MCSLNQVAVVGVFHVYLPLSRVEVTARVKIKQKWIACSRQTTFLYQVCDEIRPSQRTLASSVDRLQQGDLSLCNTRRIVPILRHALWYEKLTCYFPASSYKMRFLAHFEIKLDIYGNSWNQTWNQPWFQKKILAHLKGNLNYSQVSNFTPSSQCLAREFRRGWILSSWTIFL